MTIAQVRMPLPMSPPPQYQVARRNKLFVHSTEVQNEKFYFQKPYTTNAKQPSHFFNILYEKWGIGFVGLPGINHEYW